MAIREQQATKQFSMRRELEDRDEPMDVSQVSRHNDPLTQKVDQLCDHLDKILTPQKDPPFVPNQLDHLIAKVTNLEKQVTKQVTKNQSKTDKRQWTYDGKPICLYCKGVGHILKECRKRKYTNYQKSKSVN